MPSGNLSIRLAVAAVALALPASVAAQAAAGLSIPSTYEGAAPAANTRDARIFGHSGALRAVVVTSPGELPLSLVGGVTEKVQWEPLMAPAGAGLLGEPVVASGVNLLGSPDDQLLGEPLQSRGPAAPSVPGIWRLVVPDADERTPSGAARLAVITKVPFASKTGPVLNGYRIGRYPTEGAGRTDVYAPPVGFIEVTRENQHFHISENFQLRQFLTKNQAEVWPKYLALDLRLVDKLELVLQELNAMGIRADRMHVMSGFRTPEYNGPGSGGRAQLSRHTYGDAADVWVDNDGNGYMDDLNGDGVVDIRDAQVMLRAVERVEQKYPELIGGAGVYVATSAHGPFIHIDVRGTPARW